VVLGVSVATLLLARTLTAAGQGAGEYVYYIPDAESRGPWRPPATVPPPPPDGAIPHGPSGMEGWGDSTIHIQNLTRGSLHFDLSLRPFGSSGVLTAAGDLAALAMRLVELDRLPNVTNAFHTGKVETNAGAGVVVHTWWAAQGATAYEAPAAARDLILPLLVRDVISHTSIFYVQNTVGRDDAPMTEENQVDMTVFDNATGDTLLVFREMIQPGESAVRDTSTEFTFDRLPSQVAGGYVGSLHIEAQEPVALLAYNEDLTGPSTSAYVARPASAAATQQILPLVQSGSTGGTLIAIAHRGLQPINVTIRYVEGAWGASPGRMQSQSFSIAARGSAFVDLGRHGMGNQPAPSFPGGSFSGSAIIEASGPILAVAQDFGPLGNQSTHSGAYNAFGPADLGNGFLVPGISTNSGKETEIFVHNPTAGNASYAIDFRADDGRVLGTARGTLAAGLAARVVPTGAGLAAGTAVANAYVSGAAALAVIVRESHVGSGVDVAVFAAPREAGGEVPTDTPDPDPDTPTPSATATQSVTPTGTVERTTPATPTTTPEARVYLPYSQNGLP
jgi:hypothetical protein